MIPKFLTFFLQFAVAAIILSQTVCTRRVDGGTNLPHRVTHGYTDCGSAAELLQVLVTNCSQTPCEFGVNKTYGIIAYYKFKNPHKFLSVVVTNHIGEKEMTIANGTVPVDVEAGMITTFTCNMRITPEFGQGLATFKAMAGDGTEHELCFTVTANLHE